MAAESEGQHLILAGGGHSHALLLRRWAMQPRRRPRAWITLVSRSSTAPYSGMVPGLVAGLYSHKQSAIDLRRLARQADVNLIVAEISGLDLNGQRLLLVGRPALRFDWLSLDVGAETNSEAGATAALPVKPLEPFLSWCAQQGDSRAVRVLGSGAAAVEVALALRARGLRPWLQTRACGLDLGSTRANQLLTRVLNEAGIVGQGPSAAEGDPGDAPTIACTGSRAPLWLAASGLPTGERGRVQTTATLQVVGRPEIFATGDCAVIAADPRPPSGVWAVRAAPVLAINLQRALTGRPLQRWRPQRQALQLLGDGGAAGPPRAIALWGPLVLGPSRWLWLLKDRIDRRFMAGFGSGGPAMAGADANAMACRGCAAKVGPAALEAALRQLEAPGGSPQQAGQPLNQDDAAVVGSGPSGEWLLQSVDGFPALVSDAWLNGRLTTLHACSDLWACGAQLESAQAVVTLPVLGPHLQSDLLHQTLAGVRSVLDPLGARLIGGHTLEARDAIAGAGLSLVLTVNGRAPAGRLWPKGPLQAGDALILVRPIGTGVLFAAAMAGAAQATWIDGALAVMEQSQAPLVALLAAHGCRACTDITGFGLLGHLGEMLAATEARLQIDTGALAALALPGALELLGAGHASTLAPANGRALALLDGPVALREPASADLLQLLIDPQTCGPLLAALPAQHATDALRALHQQGFEQAAVIGRVLKPLS